MWKDHILLKTTSNLLNEHSVLLTNSYTVSHAFPITIIFEDYSLIWFRAIYNFRSLLKLQVWRL